MMKLLQNLSKPIKSLYRPIIRRLLRHLQERKNLQALQLKIKTQIREQKLPYQVIVGAGITTYEGWIATDYPALDITNAKHWQTYFPSQSIRRIVAEHVLEHLTDTQLQDFLVAVKPYLSHDGRIRIAVPDGYHPDPAYIEYVRPDGSGPGADDHKILYTYDKLRSLLRPIGFACEELEYYDEKGIFHQKQWDARDGAIQRTSGHRSVNGQSFAYTSLIIDCWIE